MRLHVLSDLHLEFRSLKRIGVHADILVLAGDIGNGSEGVGWAQATGMPAVMIAGNHEFYGHEVHETLSACHRHAHRSNVRFLENQSAVVSGARFIGCCMWTDFSLGGNPEAFADIRINDFKLIKYSPMKSHISRRFRPADAAKLHAVSKQFLLDELQTPFDGPTVVVTHFLPSPRSIAPRHASSDVNPYFCVDLEPLIERFQPALWIHGHSHDSTDYKIGGTRVVCNPRGYSPVELNPDFDASFTVEI